MKKEVLSQRKKPKCVQCGRDTYTGASYSTPKGFICNACWEERLRLEKLKQEYAS